MEEPLQNKTEERERETLFSKTIKAGKRTYYIDVRRDRRNEVYLTITENKKIVKGSPVMGQVSYEKHKLFLYKEDFAKFRKGLDEALLYAGFRSGECTGEVPTTTNDSQALDDTIHIDIEF